MSDKARSGVVADFGTESRCLMDIVAIALTRPTPINADRGEQPGAAVEVDDSQRLRM